VQLISPVLTDVPENQRLYQRLGELSHRIPIGRLYYFEGTVWLGVTVFGREFRPNHFMFAVTVIRRLADELDDDLLQDFGGRRFFSDPQDTVPTAPEPPPEEPFPGLYL
jgi:hypothetical protein